MSAATWSVLRARLGDDLSPEALEIARRATAPARHQARVDATIAAAEAAAVAEDCHGGAAVLIALDIAGVGGHMGTGASGGTARMPWARSLGRGRWHASDGDAYRAAAESAIVALTGRTPDELVVRVSAEREWLGRTVLCAWFDWHADGVDRCSMIEHFADEESAMWVDAAARRIVVELAQVAVERTLTDTETEHLRHAGLVMSARSAAVARLRAEREELEADERWDVRMGIPGEPSITDVAAEAIASAATEEYARPAYSWRLRAYAECAQLVESGVRS